MPSPDRVSVESITSPSGLQFIPNRVRTDARLICNVTLNMLVDIPVTITYTWTGPHREGQIQQSSSVATISSLTLEDAGVYTCAVDVRSTNPFIDGTGTSMDTTNVALCKLEIKNWYSIFYMS